MNSATNKFLKMNSAINFITPSRFCDKMPDSKIIDLRHDTVFNKITEGAKYNYRHLKNADNYFAGKRNTEVYRTISG